MYCPNCGTQNADASRFCLKCGNALPATTPTAGAAQFPAAVSGDRESGKRKQTIVAVVVVMVIALVVIALAVSQQSGGGSFGGSWRPTKPGVYLKSGRVELTRQRAMDPSQRGAPQTPDSQPILLVYLPGEDTQYLQFMRVSGGKRNLGFDTLSFDNGVYEIQPLNALGGGVYCVVLGGPLMSPTDVSWWCFQVNP